MKNLRRPTPSFLSRLLHGGKTNLLVALVMATGMIAALSIFASGGELVHPNCPQPVTKWAFDLGWKNPDTFTCKPDFSKHTHDALPGSVAEEEFKNIKTTAQLKEFLKSSNPKAELFRKSAKDAMSAESYKAWASGDNFVAVQFKKPAVIKGNSYLVDGKIEYNDSHNRPVPAGDILFVFVDPTQKQASLTDQAAQTAAGILPEPVNASAATPAPTAPTPGAQAPGNAGSTAIDPNRGSVKVNVDPNISVNVKVSGDCKGDNSRATGADGAVTFKNCTPGKHTVTVDKTVKVGGKAYKTKQPTQTVTVKKGGTVNAAFKYEKDETVGGELTGKVNALGNIRLDCGNVRIIQISPKDKQVIGSLRVIKFEDKNGNGKEDKGEPRMKNVKFYIKGVGNFKTDAKGEVEIKNLDPDTYTVKEIQNAETQGYTPSTKDTQKAKVKANQTETLKFGNKTNAKKGSIKIIKFEDKNGNGTQEAGEPRMKGVEFSIKGHGIKKTNAEGVIVLKDLPLGQKIQVTERIATLNGTPEATTQELTATEDDEETVESTEPAGAAAATNGGKGKKNDKGDKTPTQVDGEQQDFGIETVTVEGVVYTSSDNFNKKVAEALKKGQVCHATNYGFMCQSRDSVYGKPGSSVRDDSQPHPPGMICYRISDKEESTVMCAKKDTFYEGGKSWSVLIVTPDKYEKLKAKAEKVGRQSNATTGNEQAPAAPASTATETASEPEDAVAAASTVAAPAGAKYEPTTPIKQTATVSEKAKALYFGNKRVATPQTGALLIGKAVDTNKDGKASDGDTPQANVKFTLTGPNGYKKTLTTNESGFAGAGGLALGEYTITETVPAGYQAVTAATQKVTVKLNQLSGAAFLNKAQTGGLLIGKAIDANASGEAEATDKPQADISFTVTGPNGYKNTVKTDQRGFAGIGGLAPGEYTVTEDVPAGFTVASTNPQVVTVVANQIAAAPFLNQYICVPTPAPTASPSASPAPTPTCVPSPTPQPVSITKAFGNLPKSGQAGLILLATFLTSAGLYYGQRYRHSHKAK